jgi:hypothetical protein
MAIIGAIAIVGMVGSLGMSTITTTTKSQDLRDKIKDVGKTSDLVNEQYKKLLENNFKLDSDIHKQLIDSMNEYTRLSTVIKMQRKLYSEQYRKTEMIGIIFIVIVFFLLLLKQFGLLSTLLYVFSTPERIILEMIFGKSTKEI